MYADIFGPLPIAEALYLKGVGIGTILALMMSVTALSFPAMVMLSKVIKFKLLALYVGLVTSGILIIGVPSGKRGITTLRIFLTIYDPFIFNA